MDTSTSPGLEGISTNVLKDGADTLALRMQFCKFINIEIFVTRSI